MEDAQVALDLGAELWVYWWNRGFNSEGRGWLARILALPGAAEPSVQRARILVGAGMRAYGQYDVAAAQAYWTDGLTVARAARDPVSIMRALNNMALIAGRRHDFVAADAMAAEGLRIAVAEANGQPKPCC